MEVKWRVSPAPTHHTILTSYSLFRNENKVTISKNILVQGWVFTGNKGQHLHLHAFKSDILGIYRVSHNTVYTFVLLISRPQKHLKVPSWTFFNSPFCIDFKTIKFVIIWCNFDRDIAKILKGSHCRN